MRKKVTVKVLAAVMSIVCLAGCSGSNGFKSTALVNASQQYGVSESRDVQDTTRLANANADSGKSYYVSKDQNDAQFVYDKYINNNNHFPKVVVNEATIVAVNEHLGDGNYTTIVYQLNLNDTDSAKDLYMAIADAYVNKDRYTVNRQAVTVTLYLSLTDRPVSISVAYM